MDINGLAGFHWEILVFLCVFLDFTTEIWSFSSGISMWNVGKNRHICSISMHFPRPRCRRQDVLQGLSWREFVAGWRLEKNSRGVHLEARSCYVSTRFSPNRRTLLGKNSPKQTETNIANHLFPDCRSSRKESRISKALEMVKQLIGAWRSIKTNMIARISTI